MKSLNVFKFIKGYIRIELFSKKKSQNDISKLLNNLIKKNIYIWNISKIDSKFYINTSVKNYLIISKLAKNYNIRTKICCRYGLPFVINKYKKRSGLLIGFFIFIIFLISMSQFIWCIEVHGNKNVNTNQLIKFISTKNIKPGKYRKNIDIKSVEQEVLLNFKDISWISINILGSKAYVEVNERTCPPQNFTTNKPCNIVASKSGIIKHVEAYCGQNLVDCGDFVVKNQIVVSGILEDKSLKDTLVQSRAKVIAQTEETIEYSQMLNYEKTIYKTISTNSYLEILNKQIPINLTKKTDSKIKKTYLTIYPKLFNISMPFCIKQCHNQTPIPSSISLSENQAKTKVLEKINQTEHKMKNDDINIISKKIINQGLKNNNYIIKIKYTLEQDIAQPQEIMIDN